MNLKTARQAMKGKGTGARNRCGAARIHRCNPALLRGAADHDLRGAILAGAFTLPRGRDGQAAINSRFFVCQHTTARHGQQHVIRIRAGPIIA
jgi:hypothetical protein